MEDVNHDYSHGSTKEDPRMMAFFDSLVQREVEGWTSNTDLSDDSVNLFGLEDDTETTHSSAVTSQSDDNNSDEGNHQNQESAENVGRGQTATDSSLQRLSDDQQIDDDDDDDDNKVSNGSDWIMHLIAKKRAQLRAAKLAKKKRKHLRRHRKKTQKYLHPYTTSGRYMYHPEGQRITEENQANGETQRLSNSMIDGLNVRRQSYRRYMAPYTIMVVDSEIDSDEGNINNLSDSDTETLTDRRVGSGSCNGTKRKRPLFCPDSDSSNDDKYNSPKLTRLDLSHSDTDVDSDNTHNTENGRFISEIIDSNASDSEVEISRNAPSSPNGENNHNNEYNSTQNSTYTNIINNPSISGPDLGLNNGSNLRELESELNLNCTDGDAVPISSISIDDNGSLLFDSRHHSLLSALEIQNNVESISISPTISNDATSSITKTDTVNGEENGILERSEKSTSENETVNDVESIENLNGTDNNRSNGKVSFSFKKRLHYCNLRNYRKHEEDL
ncbi:hypothetical protein SK128_006608 [Halocaridina rubra]|uniref:Uncharacterized protein n=1 Tax=Halocaridina rubra TaxID=373956 RepID=A0AAN8X7W5_HALRR